MNPMGREQITVAPDEAIRSMLEAKALLIDVRTQQEFDDEHIAESHHIPYERIAMDIARVTTDRSQPIIVFCHMGLRSEVARAMLEQSGYTHVVNGGSLQRMQSFL